jgi:hypothetical protein
VRIFTRLLVQFQTKLNRKNVCGGVFNLLLVNGPRKQLATIKVLLRPGSVVSTFSGHRWVLKENL